MTTGQATLIMLIVGLVFLVFPRSIALVYTNDAFVVPHIVSYLVINAFCQPFLAVGMVLSGALQGAGDTRFPTFVEFICNYPIRLGLAWLLALKLGYGASGAWASMSISNIFWGFMIMLWFRKGHWKTLKI